MNRPTLALAAAALAFGGLALPHQARAQGPIVVTPGADDEDVTFGDTDDVEVRDYVVRRAPPQRIYEENTTFRIGSMVPPDVELSPMADIGKGRFNRLAYFDAAGGKVVVVDPRSRRVVRILDR